MILPATTEITPVAFLFGQLLLVYVALAVVAEMIGLLCPARLTSSWSGSAIFAVGLAPRAEVSLLVVATAGTFGLHKLPNAVFPVMILVTLSTSKAVPITLERQLETTSIAKYVSVS